MYDTNSSTLPAPQLVRRLSDDTDTLRDTMRDVARAIAEQRLKLSEATVEDLHSAARGEIDTDEVVRRITNASASRPRQRFHKVHYISDFRKG